MDDVLQVLLVDDEYYFRQLLLNLIDWPALGYRVKSEADNGPQALELARGGAYDLIIADINMPGMSGLDFVGALRSSDNETKVVFVTSYDVFEYARTAVALGASYYLLKPVDEEELAAALRKIRGELLGNRRRRPAAGELRRHFGAAEPAVLSPEPAGRNGAFSQPLDRAEWLLAVRNADGEALSAKIDRICAALASERAGKEAVLFVLMECVSLGGSAILERGGALPDGWLSERHPLFGHIYGLETVSALKEWLDTFFRDMVLAELEKLTLRGKSSDIVAKAIAYIARHYGEESVSLQQTAQSICVNPSYLSHMFKKETGKPFTEYLADVRLERAWELLREGAPEGEGADSRKIVDVSQKVGYSDPYYFSRCFKKKYGIPPSKIVQAH